MILLIPISLIEFPLLLNLKASSKNKIYMHTLILIPNLKQQLPSKLKEIARYQLKT
jgi:hypothetical protein